MWAVHEKPFKAIARRYALGTKKKKSAILLPGQDCVCLREGIYSGVFDTKNTHFTFVEREIHVVPHIKNHAENLGVENCHYHFGDLEQLSVDRNFDFAYIDLFGNITPRSGWWLHNKFRYRLDRKADVGITLNLYPRTVTFIGEIFSIAKKLTCFDGVCRAVEDFVEDKYVEFSAAYLIFLSQYCLAGFWDKSFVYGYQDGKAPMVFIKFIGWNRPCKINKTGEMFQEVVHHFFRSIPMVDEKRRAAALKAVETRRRKKEEEQKAVEERHKKMVLAGYKSWETRRKNKQEALEQIKAIEQINTKKTKKKAA